MVSNANAYVIDIPNKYISDLLGANGENMVWIKE